MSENFKGINYECFGNPEKPAVLFIHGFMGNSSDWHAIIALINKQFFCITIDLPGHGRSNNADWLKNLWDFKTICMIINELLLHLSIKRTHMVGYSMGGRFAQHFVNDFPEKVIKLVLESSSFGIKDKAERTLRLKADHALATRIKTESFRDFLDTWFDQPLFHNIKNHSGYKKMLKERLKNDPELMSMGLRAFSVANQVCLKKRLSGIKNPILYICGEEDEKYLAIAKSFKQSNRDLKLLVVEECGHNTHFEKPNLFAEHLIEFLSL